MIKDIIGTRLLTYILLFIGVYIALMIYSSSIEGGHPSPVSYIVIYMGIAAFIQTPLIIVASIIGIKKAAYTWPRYSAWKCLVSLFACIAMTIYLIVLISSF